MPVSSATELYHPPNARFQNGNRVYKVVMLGEGGVGKSALTLQFVMNTFQEDHDPTIEDAYQKQAVIDGHTCILDVLDTAGQDEFTAMREQYMRGGEGFLLVYSVTERSTFMALRQFKAMIDRVRNYDNIPMILVGNKSDLEKRRKVSAREGEAMAKEFGCTFFETSAALRHNVDQIYHSIVRCIRRKEQAEHGGGKPQLNQSSKSSVFSCCLSSPTN